jgi:hypothetical protein
MAVRRNLFWGTTASVVAVVGFVIVQVAQIGSPAGNEEDLFVTEVPVSSQDFLRPEGDFAGVYLFPHEVDDLERPTGDLLSDTDAREDWVAANGGVDAAASHLAFALFPSADTVIHDLGLTDVSCTDAPRGSVVILDSSGGPVDAYYASFVPDVPGYGASLFLPTDDESADEVEPWVLPWRLEAGEESELLVVVRPEAQQCQWKLRMDYSVNGEAKRLVLDRGGQSFVTCPVDFNRTQDVWYTKNGRDFQKDPL